MEKGKRRRVVISNYSHDFCKTCRKKKVKCDGGRPACQKCIRANLVCEYSSWELAVREDKAIVHDDITAANALAVGEKKQTTAIDADTNAVVRASGSHLEDVIGGGAINRTQMLATFLRDRFPRENSVGPYANHMHNSSLPHLCAQVDFSTPLLQRAIDTICLAHLASKSQDPWMVHNASLSRGRLLNQLRGAILLHPPPKPSKQHILKLPPTRPANAPPTNAQSIMITILLLSIAPPLAGDSNIAQRQSGVHLEGALQFFTKYGLEFLTGHAALDSVLIRQLQFQGSVVAIARRKNLEFHNPEWGQRVMLEEDLTIYAKSGYFGTGETTRGQTPVPPSVPVDRNILRSVFVPLPKHLETADTFARRCTPHPQAHLDAAATVVQRSNDAYVHNVLPGLRDSPAKTRAPPITILDIDQYNLDIEEHVYLLQHPKVITQHFHFLAPRYTFPSINLRLACLLTDCASLKIIEHGMRRNGLPPDWTGVRKADLERRAYVAAFEICQHVHYISQRSLTAGRFLQTFVASAHNFFRCFAADEEAEWCEGCLEAISARIERLGKGPDADSLCPVLDSYELMVDGCNYK